MIRFAAILTVSALVLVLQGCQTCKKTAAAPNTCKTIMVQVTEDQMFVCDGEKLSVEEFFEQADYAKDSDIVILDVNPKSQVAEATIVKAIDFLVDHGHTVTMSKTSKYQHLTP